MQYATVSEIVESFGLPCAYRFFEKETAKPAPFVCYYYGKNNDLFADNINYQTIVNLFIELYEGHERNIGLEKRIEDIMSENELSYSKESIYIEDEQMYETIYEMEVVING